MEIPKFPFGSDKAKRFIQKTTENFISTLSENEFEFYQGCWDSLAKNLNTYSISAQTAKKFFVKCGLSSNQLAVFMILTIFIFFFIFISFYTV